MNTSPIGIMRVKIHILYQVCEYSLCVLPVKSTCLSALFFWATFFLWDVTVIQKDLNISGSSKPREENWEEKNDRRVTFYSISSKLTSARGRMSGQKATLFWSLYLLKKVVTISVTAAKKSARVSCTKTCTWKNRQVYSSNCLRPWNIRHQHFRRT